MSNKINAATRRQLGACVALMMELQHDIKAHSDVLRQCAAKPYLSHKDEGKLNSALRFALIHGNKAMRDLARDLRSKFKLPNMEWE